MGVRTQAFILNQKPSSRVPQPRKSTLERTLSGTALGVPSLGCLPYPSPTADHWAQASVTELRQPGAPSWGDGLGLWETKREGRVDV